MSEEAPAQEPVQRPEAEGVFLAPEQAGAEAGQCVERGAGDSGAGSRGQRGGEPGILEQGAGDSGSRQCPKGGEATCAGHGRGWTCAQV